MYRIIRQARVMEPESIRKNGESGKRNFYRAFYLPFVLIFFLSISTQAQNVYNLNADQVMTLRSDNRIPQEFSKEAKASRAFAINPALQSAKNIIAGDIVNLQLFEGKSYPATISSTLTDVNDNFTLTLKLPDYPMAWAIITTSREGKSLVNVSVPELGLSVGSRYSPSTNGNYLIEMDESKIERPHLENDAIEIPKGIAIESDFETQLRNAQAMDCGPVYNTNVNTSEQIDLLIVYTPAAASSPYAVSHSGINNIIATMIALGNTCLNNSQTGITLRLACSAQVNYSEKNDMNVTLQHLRNNGDGYMDEVHALRSQYNADLVQLISTDNNSGGLGYSLRGTGAEKGDFSIGFSVVWVTQVGDTYPCSVHELGHNMGLGHGAQQTSSAADGIFSYSKGWRWTGNTVNGYGNNQYASVMSYSGDFYGDGITPMYTPYFSNPSVTYLGGATGDASQADAARTLREMKHVIAYYSDRLSNLPDMPANILVSNPTDNGATFSWNACTNTKEYRICFPIGNGYYSYFIIPPQYTSASLSNAMFSPCKTYEFWITSVNECGDQSQSSTYTFATKCTASFTISTSSNPSTGGLTKGGGTINGNESCTVCATANTGYTFTNWTENGSIVSTSSCYSFTVSANRDLVANFTPVTYTVAYNGNGNTGGNTASSSHTYNVAKNLTNNGFTRVYTVTYNYNGNGQPNGTATATYTFKNWNTLSGGGGTTYTNGQNVLNLSSINGEKVNLYAQWNSGSVILPAPNTRPEYTFAGWYTAESGGTRIGDAGAAYIPAADIVLFAQWIIVTAIETVKSGKINIYPNPAESEIFIKSEIPVRRVEIYSLTGSLLLLEEKFNEKISVSALPKGIHLIKVYTDNGLVISKIAKE